MTLSPEPLGFLVLDLLRQDRPWAGGLPIGGPARRWQGCIGARGTSPQGSILRGNVDSLGSVDFTVNYSPKLCFIRDGVWYPSALCRRWLP